MSRIAITLSLAAATILMGCDRTPKGQPKPPDPATPMNVSKPTMEPAAANTPGSSSSPGMNMADAGSTMPETSAPDADPAKSDLIQLAGAVAPKPASWQWTKPTMQFRSAQYIVPARDGTGDGADFIVSIFAAGDGGPVQTNIDRWAGQFRNADGSPVKASPQTITRDGMTLTTVELKGAYQGMGAAGPKQDQMQLGAIIEGDDGTTFLRLLGPAKTVEAHRAEWDAVIAGIKPQG